MILVCLAAGPVLQCYAWPSLLSKVRARQLGKPGAACRYAAWALAPAGWFVVASLGAVASDEWLGSALISEPDARGATIVLGALLVLALAGWTAFVVKLTLVRDAS